MFVARRSDNHHVAGDAGQYLKGFHTSSKRPAAPKYETLFNWHFIFRERGILLYLTVCAPKVKDNIKLQLLYAASRYIFY